MEKDIAIGAEGKASLVVASGKVILAINYTGKQASAVASVSLDVEQFAQLLKDAIPGSIDDAVIDILVAALKVAA